MSGWPSWSHGYRYLAVAVGAAIGDDVYVHRHSTSKPLPLPSEDLLDLLRRIAFRDDAPDTVQADARDYLEHLETASSASGSLTGEARLTMAATAALWHGREVVQGCRGLGAGRPDRRVRRERRPRSSTSEGRDLLPQTACRTLGATTKVGAYGHQRYRRRA